LNKELNMLNIKDKVWLKPALNRIKILS